MKIPVLFLMVAIATVNSPLVHATECTEDDLISISEIYSQAMSDGTATCPDLTAASDTTDYCSFTECLRFMTGMLDDLPDCTSAGDNIKEGLQAAIDICKDGTADTSDVFTDTSSSSAFATDTSSSSELTADSSSSSAFATDASSSSSISTDSATSSSSPLLRTVSPPDSTTSDKITADSGGSSSSASSISMALSSAALAMTVFIVAVGL